jgi:hypothetical protein
VRFESLTEREEPQRDTTVRRAAPPPHPILALQRGAGNASVARMLSATRPMLQRENDDWALALVKQTKQKFDRYGKFGGSGGALHHHISRHTLDSVAHELEQSIKDRDPDTKAAALKFEREVTAIIQELLVDLEMKPKQAATAVQGLDLRTKLNNLPMNLHYGPQVVVGDPGIGFDGTTIPKQGGGRQLDPTTEVLLRFETAFGKAVDTAKGNALSAKTWGDFSALLAEANQSYEDRYKAVGMFENLNTEQWMKGQGKGWHKKGDLNLPGQAHGLKLLAGAVAQDDDGDAAEVVVERTIKCKGGDELTVKLGATKSSVTHFCNRHTYAHFDFDVKGVNVFWPAGTTRQDLVGKVADVADALLAYSKAMMSESPAERMAAQFQGDLTAFVGEDGVKTTSADGIYYYVKVADQPWVNDEEDVVNLEVTMLAPSGTQFSAYSLDELEAIGDQLGVYA